MIKYSTEYRDIVQEAKAPMEARRAAAEQARKTKLEAADPKQNYEFSEGYCRRGGDPARHDHRSRSINTQDRTACQFNCDANKDCVAFEMAPRCWWYTRDTDLAGAGQAKRECWVKKPATATPEPPKSEPTEGVNHENDTKIAFEKRECGEQGLNFGTMKTPEDCAIVAGKEGYDYFMFSKEYPTWGCRGCSTGDGGKDHKLWNVFAVDGDYTRYKKDYYNAKAKYDLVTEFVEQGRDAILQEELESEKIELAETEKTGIVEAINKYTNYKTASGMPSKQTGDLLLKKFEDNAKQTMDKYLQQTRKQAEQPAHDEAEVEAQAEVRRKYFKAKAIYEEIAEKTGADSPSKVAERQVIATAEVNKKKAAVTTAITKCFAPSEIVNTIKD